MAALLCAILLLAAGDGPKLLELKEGSIAYSVIHKLHQVKGSTREIEGRAQVRQDGALRVQVRAKIATFDSGNSNRDEHVREVTHETAHPYVQIKGSASGLQLPISAPQEVKLDCVVELNGVQRPQTVVVRLAPEPGGVRGRFSFPISLDAFHVERPELLFVKVEDRAEIEGDLLFAEVRQ